MIRKDKIGKTNLLFVFFIIFFSSDTLLFGVSNNQYLVKLGYLIDISLIIVLPFVMAMEGKKIKLKLWESRITITLIGALILSSLMNCDIRGGYVMSIAMALLAFVVSGGIPFEDFCKTYAFIFFLLALCSLIGFAFFSFLPELNQYGFIARKSIGGTTFHHYFLYMHCTDDTGAGRNWGIFREPGVYQLYLIIALLIEIFYYNKKDRKRNIIVFGVLASAILTTKSTTGYIALILVILYFLLKEKYFTNYKNAQNLVVILGALFFLAALVVAVKPQYFFELYKTHFSKFDKTSVTYSSFYARFSSIGVNTYLWFLNPLFGNGITDKELLFSQTAKMLYGVDNYADTNTILAQFSIYGFIVGMVWVYSVINMGRRVGRNMLERIVLLVLFLLLLMTEFLVFSPLCNIFIWYGIQKSYGKNKQRGQLVYRQQKRIQDGCSEFK